MPFWNLAEPVIESLVATVHESCSAAVLDHTGIVYALRVPTHSITTVNLFIGSRLPAYCTPMGRVLLSELPHKRIDPILDASPLTQRTPRTLTDKAQIKQSIAQVREQG